MIRRKVRKMAGFVQFDRRKAMGSFGYEKLAYWRCTCGSLATV